MDETSVQKDHVPWGGGVVFRISWNKNCISKYALKVSNFTHCGNNEESIINKEKGYLSFSWICCHNSHSVDTFVFSVQRRRTCPDFARVGVNCELAFWSWGQWKFQEILDPTKLVTNVDNKWYKLKADESYNLNLFVYLHFTWRECNATTW